MSQSSKIVKEFFASGILQYGEFTLKSGITSPYYFDLRKIISYPGLLNNFTEYLANYIKKQSELEYDKVAGVPYGGIPLAVSLGNHLNLPIIMPRKEKKDYGSKKEIEGFMEIGDDILLIEDTVTTGGSALETIKMIERNGGVVSGVVIVMDREEGGVQNIENAGYNVYSLFNISNIALILASNQLIEEFQYEKIAHFANTQKKLYMRQLENIDNHNADEEEIVEEKTDTFSKILRHRLRASLIELIIEKQTALCLSLDTSTWEEGKKILEACGDKIVMVKTHVELYEDFGPHFEKEIKELAAKHKFFIMEDRKLSDISKISWRQMMLGHFKIDNWASFITCHGITAKGFIDYYQQMLNSKYPINIALCLVTQMNIDSKLLGLDYTKTCLEYLEDYDEVSPIIVCQCLPNIKDRLKLTPGVSLEHDWIDGSQYRSVETAITEQGNHIIIVGSNIVYAEEPEEEAKLFAAKSWECFQESYPSLIEESKRFKEEFLRKEKETTTETKTETTTEEATTETKTETTTEATTTSKKVTQKVTQL